MNEYKLKTTIPGLEREDVLRFPPYLGDLVEDAYTAHQLFKERKDLIKLLEAVDEFLEDEEGTEQNKIPELVNKFRHKVNDLGLYP